MYHESNYRVSYGDTDQMAVVYYGNYLEFFERARTEMLRDCGLPYRDAFCDTSQASSFRIWKFNCPRACQQPDPHSSCLCRITDTFFSSFFLSNIHL